MKVYVVIKDWSNDMAYEDFDCGECEYCGVYSTVDKAKEAVKKLIDKIDVKIYSLSWNDSFDIRNENKGIVDVEYEGFGTISASYHILERELDHEPMY